MGKARGKVSKYVSTAMSKAYILIREYRHE